tara:strand:+ start:2351 stop:4273 length:1923 start_codon:yes stop_codon:yes gene_type:complete
MKKVVLSLVLLIFSLVVNGQDILKIQNDNISLSEFKNIFYKNNHDSPITKEYLDEYMNLFVNFKLKVKEAEELGLDTVSSFITELSGYKKQLAAPYLKNKTFDENMLIEAYNRMQQDINASHILIAIDEKSTSEEENTARNKALDIREKISSGKISFSDAAKKYSDDKSANYNGGNLGYFTVFMMVYDFETAAYKTAVNNISMPVRTKYGFHLVKVNDKRDAVGEVKVAHIMFKTGEGADQRRLDEAKEKILKAMRLLEDGEDFSDVAERFSEDRSTAVKGGSLPKFGVGKMVAEFEKEAFSLQNIGDISNPFQTGYGWHILTLLEKEPVPEFDEVKSDIKIKIKKDSRGELSQKALYKKLRNSYKVVNKPSVYSEFRRRAALKVSNGEFNILYKNNQTLLSINNQDIPVNSFAEYIMINQIKGSDIDNMYLAFVDERLLLLEESKLEDKYPEYKALLKEYREGILLFDLTNKKVWKKAVEDTLGLQTYFNENRSNYKWENRLDATIYTCIDLKTAKSVKKDIYKKHRNKIKDAEILKRANNKSVLSLQIESKKFVKGENLFIDQVEWKKGIANDIILKDGSCLLIDIHQVLPSALKELNETRGKVISDYQAELEKDWISSLKEKYSVVINNKVLHSLIK